MSIEQQRFLV